MRLASKEGTPFREALAFRWFRLGKRIRQARRFHRGQDKTVVLVVGCQRSGTSMLHHLFRLDWTSVTYDEISPLSSGDDQERLRWTSWPDAHARIQADRSPLVVAKPIVESQNVRRLLDLFNKSRAIWMYRDFRDVAASNLAFFGQGNGHHDLQTVLGGVGPSWKSEHVDGQVLSEIKAVYRRDLEPFDAAALFWYARNSLFFSEGCHEDPRIVLCRYDDLTTRAGTTMADAYAFIDLPYPGDRIVADVKPPRVRRPSSVVTDPGVAAMCETMLSRLDARPRL